MKSRKLRVFWTLTVQFIALYILTLFQAPELLNTIGVPLITFMWANGAAYIGGNVWQKWVISSNYVKELKNEQ